MKKQAIKITTRVTNYADICAIDGVDPVQSLPFPEPKTPDEEAINSVAKVFRINRVLNEGWTPDWNNSSQYKYYPWFDMRSAAGSGSGFSFGDYCYDGVCSGVGARLVYKSRELAEFAGQTFLAEYRGFMVIEQ